MQALNRSGNLIQKNSKDGQAIEPKYFRGLMGALAKRVRPVRRQTPKGLGLFTLEEIWKSVSIPEYAAAGDHWQDVWNPVRAFSRL